MIGPSLMDLPREIIDLIPLYCNARTLRAFADSCHFTRSQYLSRWMRADAAARNVFYNPILYTKIPQFSNYLPVVLNAVSKIPSLIFHPSMPPEISANDTVKKTALVAAHFADLNPLYQRLRVNPELRKIASELEGPPKRINQNSELWGIQSFIMYSPLVTGTYKNVTDEMKRHLDLTLYNLRLRRITPEDIHPERRKNEEVMRAIEKRKLDRHARKSH